MKQSLLRQPVYSNQITSFFFLANSFDIRSFGADPRATRPWDNSCNVTWQMPWGVQR